MSCLRALAGKISNFGQLTNLVNRKLPVTQVVKVINPSVQLQLTRGSRYIASPVAREDPSTYPEFEITFDPEEWKYVEAALPRTEVPKPTATTVTPSGWIPPKLESMKLPYFIRRTRNHMLPVYLNLSRRDSRKITIIKFIEGDILLFEKHLRHHIEQNEKNTFRAQLGSQIHEMHAIIKLRGDYVNRTIQFLEMKGF